MSLRHPTDKMSKSDTERSRIAITDTVDDVARKIMKAVTDSDGSVRYDKEVSS